MMSDVVNGTVDIYAHKTKVTLSVWRNAPENGPSYMGMRCAVMLTHEQAEEMARQLLAKVAEGQEAARNDVV